MIDQTISHYRIKQKLGGGGMGVVYLAEDTRLERSVAIKFLPPAYFEDDQAVKRFQREAKAAAALNHPYICHVYDIGEEDGQPYLVMEHLEGETLKHKLAKGPLPLNEALKLAVQIADALQTAHSKGIIHRDIKPANIFFTERGDAKVLDFGLAKQLGKQAEGEEDLTTALTRAGSTLGTLNYMSPEQVKGEVLDARTDIFSLGVVLYEMLTGLNPFRRDTSGETASCILKEDPPPLSRYVDDAPEALQHILRKMLAKDPKRRSQSMHGVQNDLEQLVEDSGRAKIEASERDLRAWWVAAAVFVLVIAIAGGWLWLGRKSDQGDHIQQKRSVLTSLPGIEQSPSFSPDGNYIAFSWNGPNEDNWDVYVQMLDTLEVTRRTDSSARDFNPVWSPDGRYIAFGRVEGETGELVLMPVVGGHERILATTQPGPWTSTTFFHLYSLTSGWAPDGSWLVSSLSNGGVSFSLVKFSVETKESRPMTTPVENLRDTQPAVSPDGRRLVFIREQSWQARDLYLLELTEAGEPEGAPRRLTFENDLLSNPRWSADGQHILYSNAGQLWEIDSRQPSKARSVLHWGGGPQERITFDLSHSTGRIVFEQAYEDRNIYRIQKTSSAQFGDPERLTTSTRSDWLPAYSPNGQRFTFISDRSGFPEVWVCDSDGGNAVALTNYQGGVGGASDWSPDGSRIAYDFRVEEKSHIYIVSSGGGQAVRLTGQDEPSAHNPRWSADGKSIYYFTNQGLRKRPSDGRDSVLPVSVKTVGPFAESHDGRFLYYWQEEGIWRIPVSGGDAEVVVERAGRFDVAEDGLFFRSGESSSELSHFSFVSGEIEKVGDIPASAVNLSVRRDGRSVLFTQTDQQGAELMLVENFR